MSKNSSKMIKAAAKQAQATGETPKPKVNLTQAKDILAEMVGEPKAETKVPAAPTTEAKADAKPTETKKAEAKPAPVEVWWEYPGLPTGLSYENLAVGLVVWGIKNLHDEPQATVFPRLPREFVVMKMTVLAVKGPLFGDEDQPDFSGVFGLPIYPRTGEDGKEITPQEVDCLLLGDGREELMATGECVPPELTGNLLFNYDDAGKASAEAMAKFLNARGRGLFLNHYIAQLKRDALLSTANNEKLTEFLKDTDTGSLWRAKTVYDGLLGEVDKNHKPVKFAKGLDRVAMVSALLLLRNKIPAEKLASYNDEARKLHHASVEERVTLDVAWSVPEGKHLGEAETPTEQANRREKAAEAAKKAEAAKAAAKTKAVKAAEGAKVPTIDEMRALVAAADAKKAEAALDKTDLQAEAIKAHNTKQTAKEAVKAVVSAIVQK